MSMFKHIELNKTIKINRNAQNHKNVDLKSKSVTVQQKQVLSLPKDSLCLDCVICATCIERNYQKVIASNNDAVDTIPIQYIKQIFTYMEVAKYDFYLPYQTHKHVYSAYTKEFFPKLVLSFKLHNVSLRTLLMACFLYLKHTIYTNKKIAKETPYLYVTYLHIAIKYHEVHPTDLDDLIFHTDMDTQRVMPNVFKLIRSEVLEYEADVLADLDYKLSVPFLLEYFNCWRHILFFPMELNKESSEEFALEFSRIFFSEYLNHPERIFCREDGFKITVREIAALAKVKVQEQKVKE